MGASDWFRRLFGLGPRRARPGAPPRVPPGSSALVGMLNALEELAEEHAEVFDTDVRERMWAVVEARFVRKEAEVPIPVELGLFTPQGNQRLGEVLDHHLGNLLAIAEAFALDTPAKRLRSLQNHAVRSSAKGYTFEDFFGAP